MIKSWLSFFLPDDEYKRQRIVYFLAEGSILLLIFLGLLFGANQLSRWSPDVDIILGLAIVVFILYVFTRYMLSGIEYTDVSTEKQYKRERSISVKKSIFFAITFFVLSILFMGVPRLKQEWIDILGISIIAAILLFLINYISLKRSYKKNKDLINN
jgi:hypothetical protein